MLVERIRILAAFAPSPVVRAMYRHVLEHHTVHMQTYAHAEYLEAATLFADISGFTSLTEVLTLQSSEGAEELTSLLNLYFTRMITHIESYNGQVVRLSGDAIIAIFPVADTPEHTLASALLYAAYAAVDMQIAMVDFQNLTTSVGEASLALKIGIGAGKLLAAHVGGVFNRWEYLIADDAMEQAANAEKVAIPGMVVLSPQAAKLINLIDEHDTMCVTIFGEDLSDTTRYMNIFLELNESEYSRPMRSMPLEYHWEELPQHALEAIEQRLHSYVPAAITKRLVARQQAWLADFRRMTVMFIGVGGLSYDSPHILPLLQSFAATMQHIIYRYEGSLNKITVDDKGTVLLVLFGAPPLAHEDDPLRTITCARELQQQIHQALQTTLQQHLETSFSDVSFNDMAAACNNIRLSIGITTDTVFAGPVGSPWQCEYTVMGDDVNLASRLMQAAGYGGTFCDYPTYNEVRRHWGFEHLPPMLVKGKSKPVRVYRFTGMRTVVSEDSEKPLVGRDRELSALINYINQVEKGLGCVVSMTGEGGMGKTRLMLEFMQQVNGSDRVLLSLTGAAHSISQQTPFLIWREVLTRYFGLELVQSIEQRTHRVLQQAHEIDPELEQRIPLLNDILDLDLPETTVTRGLAPRQRRDTLSFLVIQLLLAWAKNNMLVVVLDDMHWADSLSWDLTLDIARVIPLRRVLLLLNYREPTNEDSWGKEKHDTLQTIRTLSHHYHLHLSPLNTNAVEQLAAAYMWGKPLARDVVTWIAERSQGNPFFVEETVRMLHEQSALELDNQGVWLLKKEYNLNTIPATLKGVIQAHLDRLQPDIQLTCKVASVVGRIFSARVVAGIHPAKNELPHITQHFDILAQHNITPLESLEPELRYQFKSALTQDVAYSSLLLSQRQALHQAVAEWYEQEYAGNLDPYMPLLAEHYRHTEQWQQFITFAERTGKMAAKNYATAEALNYLSQAIELVKTRSDVIDKPQEHLFSLLLARANVYEHINNLNALANDLHLLDNVAVNMEDTQRQAMVYIHWTRYYQTINDYDAAEQAARRALKLSKQLQDYQLLGETMNLLARNAELRASYQQALWWGLQALDYCREVHDKSGEAYSLNFLGIANAELGDYAQAEQYHEQALAIRRTIDDRWGESESLKQLGSIYSKLGKPREALTSYIQALEIRRSIGDRSGEAFSLLDIGSAYQVLGNLSTAQTYQQEARMLWRELGNQYGEATLLIDMSDTATILGDFDVAQRYATEGIALARVLGNRRLEAHCLAKLGNAMREMASWQRRVQQQEEAVATSLELQYEVSAPPATQPTQPTLPMLLDAHILVAKEHHRMAHTLARKLGLRRLEAYALHHLGEWEWEWSEQSPEQRAESAASYWQQAAAIREEIGEIQFVRASQCRYAQALVILHRHDEARAVLDVIWQDWEKQPPTGEDEDELREGYLALYETWTLLGDPLQASVALAWAYQGVQDRAQCISDTHLRELFLTRVSVNAAIIEAWDAFFNDHTPSERVLPPTIAS